MRKTTRTSLGILCISIALAFILLITLTIGHVGVSYQEAKIKTLNSDKITLTADDNNAFSDLSRNMSAQSNSK